MEIATRIKPDLFGQPREDHFKFEFEIELAEMAESGRIPDYSGPAYNAGGDICKFYLRGMCMRGTACPYRHSRGNEKAVVCKHYLRALCKKGGNCEYLHQYDLSKMPNCFFYREYGECSRSDCMFLHIDPEKDITPCPWFDKGFCKHGPSCRHRHTKKQLCPLYYEGFCPKGPDCNLGHPRYEIFEHDRRGAKIICHKCGEPGHRASNCTSGGGPNRGYGGAPNSGPRRGGFNNNNPNSGGPGGYQKRNMDHVTCFKCGEQGHLANACPNPKKRDPSGQNFRGPPQFNQGPQQGQQGPMQHQPGQGPPQFGQPYGQFQPPYGFPGGPGQQFHAQGGGQFRPGGPAPHFQPGFQQQQQQQFYPNFQQQQPPPQR